MFRENGCDCIIAFGGGSDIDCAKAIGAKIARPQRSVRQLQGRLKVLRPIPVLFAVPTTAGSGSETTISAVITENETRRKAALTDPVLMPKYVVLDPELTVSLPPQQTAASGMDALCHAVEAYINGTYNTKVERQMAVQTVKLIRANLLKAYADGADLEARQKLQEAAFCSGRAFTRGGLGYACAMARPLSGLYGVSHGYASAILMPHVLRSYGETVEKSLAELYDLCEMEEPGTAGNASKSMHEKAEAFIRWIEEMKEKLDITGLSGDGPGRGYRPHCGVDGRRDRFLLSRTGDPGPEAAERIHRQPSARQRKARSKRGAGSKPEAGRKRGAGSRPEAGRKRGAG